jgi:hypothetical protein
MHAKRNCPADAELPVFMSGKTCDVVSFENGLTAAGEKRYDLHAPGSSGDIPVWCLAAQSSERETPCHIEPLLPLPQ